MPRVIPPVPDADDRPFWEGVAEERLLLQRCADCKAVQHPPSPMCPQCQSVQREWFEVSGRGSVYSWIQSHHPTAPDEAPRIVALTDAFLDYLERRVFPGGCFFASAAVEFGARPCRVKEALAEFQRGWADLLERLIEEAFPGSDASQLAFEVNGMLLAANAGFQFSGDPAVIERARRGIERLLAG